MDLIMWWILSVKTKDGTMYCAGWNFTSRAIAGACRFTTWKIADSHAKEFYPDHETRPILVDESGITTTIENEKMRMACEEHQEKLGENTIWAPDADSEFDCQFI